MIKKGLSRLVASMPNRVRHYYHYRLLGNMVFPEIVHIENTNACNAQCIICARDKMERKIGFMDFDLFKKIVDECAARPELKQMHVHGFGEPLLDKRLFERIHYAKQKDIKEVYFVTNASLLTQEHSCALLKAGVDTIKFSVYGNSCETFEAIHRGLKYQTVIDNICGFFNLRKNMGLRKPAVKVQFLQHKINMHEREAFLAQWSDLIDKDCGDKVVEFPIHNWIYGRDYHSASKNNKKKKSCGIPFVSLQILWNGDATVCCYDYDGKMNFGNVQDTSIAEIWNSAKLNKLRKLHRRAEFDKLKICGICDQLR